MAIHAPLQPRDIAALRLKMGLTLFEFGQLVGVGESTVCTWEKGRRHPTWKNMERIHAVAANGHRRAGQASPTSAPERGEATGRNGSLCS